MSNFSYVVRDRSGRVMRGRLEAPDRDAAVKLLRDSGKMVTSLQEVGAGGGFSLSDLFKRVKLKDLAVFSKQFSAMVESGIDVLRCLTILQRQSENQYLREILSQVHDDVAEGQTLSQALGKHTRAFPRLFVSLIRASEESGSLDVVLARLADSLEKEVSLRNQVSAGMKYPQVIGIAALIILTVMMIFVIPVFKQMFASLGGQLPLSTRMLVGAATWMKKYWYILVVIYFGIPFVVRQLGHTAVGRELLDRLKLRLPVFGALTQKVIVARFTRNLATMLGNGIPILRALDIVDESADNVVFENAIARIRNAVKEGDSIAGPMEAVKLFPPMVPAMIAVGEESGDLDGMLSKVADFYDSEVEAMVKALTSLLEPILISVMGAVVGFIVISLFLPLFNLIKLVRDMGK